MPIEAMSLAKMIAVPMGKWLLGLWTADKDRQLHAVEAVDAVHSLLRRTRAYSRLLERGHINVETESLIAAEWSEVSLRLRRLGEQELADRCDIKSRYWVDPEQFKAEVFSTIDISFGTMEKLARDTRIQIQHKLPRQRRSR